MPSVASRPPTFSALSPRRTRSSSTAFSMSPSVSVSAFLHSIMAAPVSLRSSPTCLAEIVGAVTSVSPCPRSWSLPRRRGLGGGGGLGLSGGLGLGGGRLGGCGLGGGLGRGGGGVLLAVGVRARLLVRLGLARAGGTGGGGGGLGGGGSAAAAASDVVPVACAGASCDGLGDLRLGDVARLALAGLGQRGLGLGALGGLGGGLLLGLAAGALLLLALLLRGGLGAGLLLLGAEARAALVDDVGDRLA